MQGSVGAGPGEGAEAPRLELGPRATADSGTQGAGHPAGERGSGGSGSARGSSIWRWLLALLAALLLGIRVLQRVAPVARMLVRWAHAHSASLETIGSTAAAGILLALFWDQAQPLRGRVLTLLRGYSIRRRPATDGDRGRDREGVPEATRTYSPGRGVTSSSAAEATADGLRSILDAILEMRDSQIAAREN